jgi:adenylate kinase
MVNIILIGAQGSGKGTQAERLATQLQLKPCASGELLRAAIAAETPAGLAARPYYDRGDLVPDHLVIDMILDATRDLGTARGIILDGFPRTFAQAQALDTSMAALGERIDQAIYLDVPRDMLLERLSGRYVCEAYGHVWNIKTHPSRVPGICDYDGSVLKQRSDDRPEKIAHRLEIFFNDTIHLLDYYRAQHKLIRVDGTGSIEQVYQEIISGLDPSPVRQSAIASLPDERSLS